MAGTTPRQQRYTLIAVAKRSGIGWVRYRPWRVLMVACLIAGITAIAVGEAGALSSIAPEHTVCAVPISTTHGCAPYRLTGTVSTPSPPAPSPSSTFVEHLVFTGAVSYTITLGRSYPYGCLQPPAPGVSNPNVRQVAVIEASQSVTPAGLGIVIPSNGAPGTYQTGSSIQMAYNNGPEVADVSAHLPTPGGTRGYDSISFFQLPGAPLDGPYTNGTVVVDQSGQSGSIDTDLYVSDDLNRQHLPAPEHVTGTWRCAGAPPSPPTTGPSQHLSPGGKGQAKVTGVGNCVAPTGSTSSVAAFWDSARSPTAVAPIPPNATDAVVSYSVPQTAGVGVHRVTFACWTPATGAGAPLAVVTVNVTGNGPSSSGSSRTQLSQAVPAPAQVSRSLTALLGSLALTVFMVLVVGFPAELFNKTVEENHEDIHKWFRWIDLLRRRARRVRWARVLGRRLSRQRPQLVIFAVVAAVLSSLVDPEVLHVCDNGGSACNGTSWALKATQMFLGFLVAIPLTVMVYGYTEEAASRAMSGKASKLRALPLGLIAAGAFAGWSALGAFLPGYVYGLIAGYADLEERKLKRREEGLAVLFGGLAVLAMSLLVWTTWTRVHNAAGQSGAGFWLLTLDTLFAQLILLGVQAVVFGLMPFEFLAGSKLWRWSRLAWLGVYGAAAFIYIHVLVVSAVDTVGKAQAGRLEASVVALFLGFGLFSVTFWGYFKLRRAYGDRTHSDDSMPDEHSPRAEREPHESDSHEATRASVADETDLPVARHGIHSGHDAGATGEKGGALESHGDVNEEV